MAKRMLARGGRAFFVGDSRQAIYGFTGASSDSLAITQRMFDCKLMPLTVTYRCAKSIVAHAHKWVSHIQAHPSAKDGIVRAFTAPPAAPGQKPLPWFLIERPAPHDAILCRYTRPLVATAYDFLRAGIACKVEGRDIGNGLCKLAQRWSIRTINALEVRLGEYLDNEIRKAQLKKNEKREHEVTDIVDTLRIFIERSRALGHIQIDQLTSEIQSLFADDVKNVTVLSTGHKAKGREWDRVFWIQANGGRPAERDWQRIEEDNIKYVICTRARDELVLVPDPPKMEKAK
jgi:superfamily I DNA/RNA helicase